MALLSQRWFLSQQPSFVAGLVNQTYKRPWDINADRGVKRLLIFLLHKDADCSIKKMMGGDTATMYQAATWQPSLQAFESAMMGPSSCNDSCCEPNSIRMGRGCKAATCLQDLLSFTVHLNVACRSVLCCCDACYLATALLRPSTEQCPRITAAPATCLVADGDTDVMMRMTSLGFSFVMRNTMRSTLCISY